VGWGGVDWIDLLQDREVVVDACVCTSTNCGEFPDGLSYAVLPVVVMYQASGSKSVVRGSLGSVDTFL